MYEQIICHNFVRNMYVHIKQMRLVKHVDFRKKSEAGYSGRVIPVLRATNHVLVRNRYMDNRYINGLDKYDVRQSVIYHKYRVMAFLMTI